METWLEGLGAAHFEQTLETEPPEQDGKETPSRKGALSTPIHSLAVHVLWHLLQQ